MKMLSIIESILDDECPGDTNQHLCKYLEDFYFDDACDTCWMAYLGRVMRPYISENSCLEHMQSFICGKADNCDRDINEALK